MPPYPGRIEARGGLGHTTWPLLACLLACLLSPTTIGAHEIGTTRVVASFAHDDTYTIEVTTDAGTLLNRLQVARKQPPTTPADADAYQRAFDDICDELPRHASVLFDAAASIPAASCLVETSGVDEASGGAGAPGPSDVTLSAALDRLTAVGVTVTLRGVIPHRAQTFRWRYDLTFARYALTMKSPEPQGATTMWLEGGEESRAVALARISAPVSRATVARSYFGLGFTHILPKGLDHILFVLGIFLLSRRLRPMLWQVSAFTLAHSITLGLTLYGVIALPSSIVEPLIALSIVYVAVENLLTTELKPWRVALVFAFGLLHGMGFAGILRELALPRSEFLTGLVAFNAGVEAGQLTVILSAFLIVGGWAQQRDGYRRLIVVPGSAAIALAGLCWTFQRIAI
jgi:hydrogenase/urease accessory protein HupE